MQEGAEDVLVLPILSCRPLDRWREPEAVTLPLEAALDRPGENARELAPQLVDQPPVLAPAEGDLEGDQAQARPHRVIVTVDPWPMVRDEPNLELGLELEVLGVEEPRRDRVAARNELDRRLVEVAALARLGREGDPGAVKARDVVPRPMPAANARESIEGARPGEVAGDPLQGLDEGRLPVAPGAVQDEEGVLARVAGERITRPLV